MNIILFSQYLAYRIGGAEESLISLGKERHQEANSTFDIISYKELSQHKVIPQIYETGEKDQISFIHAKYPISFFPYINYFLNHSSSSRFFKEKKGDTLYCSSIFAPTALLSFQGKEKYFYIQSEIDLGAAWNHEEGIRFFFKFVYNLIELPFRLFHKYQFNKSIKETQIICCSEFIASQFKKRFPNKEIHITYPPIHYEKLKKDYSIIKKTIPLSEKGIVFIGDAPYKGIRIAKELTEMLPDIKFHFFSRRAKKITINKNVHIHPWQKDIANIYSFANLVIMPSFCKESFGRVAREAYSLGIPVLVSNHGGLPEAVHYDEKCLVNNFKNVNEWIKKIKTIQT